MSEHTPGPWRECRAGDCTCGMVWSIPGDFPVCTAAGGSTFPPKRPVAVAHEHMADAPDMIYASMPKEECAANARLIAAAPELLDALKSVLRVADRQTVEFDAARAAIAKAEGRS